EWFAVVRSLDKVYISAQPVTITAATAAGPPPAPPGAPPAPPGAPPAPPGAPPVPPGAPPVPPGAPPAPPDPAAAQPGQPPVPAGPGPGGIHPAPAAAPVEMREYRDPGGRFTLEYPVGWRTQLMEGGFVGFYKDHPEEGIAYIVQPWAELNGPYTGSQIVSLFSNAFRKRYPDLQILGQDVATIQRQQYLRVDKAILEAAWTNKRGERMKARVAIVVGALQAPGLPARSIFHYWAYQAPEVAWDAMQDTFIRIHQSYQGQSWVSQPP
ncbi:MAG: hypothetical protein ACT4P5_16330, partial [Armatimonadota bacterium]